MNFELEKLFFYFLQNHIFLYNNLIKILKILIKINYKQKVLNLEFLIFQQIIFQNLLYIKFHNFSYLKVILKFHI